jgi:hypothetical protein
VRSPPGDSEQHQTDDGPVIAIAETSDRQRILLTLVGQAFEIEPVTASWLGQRLMDRARHLVASAADDPKRTGTDTR